MSGFDTIVIGAGHNGLAAATRLAKAGQRVLVLEQSDAPGGAMARYAHLTHGLGAAEIAELGLADFGYETAVADIPTVALCPSGRHVVLDRGTVTYADGAPHLDALAYQRLRDRLVRYAGALAPISRRAPPALTGGGVSQALDLGKIALKLRMQGEAETREFMRLALSNVYDTVLDEIPDGPLAGVLGIDAVLGGHMGPRAPGTMLGLLMRLREGGARHLPKGGMGRTAAAFAKAAQAAGVDIRYGAKVREIRIDNDRTTGVVIEDGTELSASHILSSLDAKTTMTLAHPRHFDAEMVRRIRHVRSRGAVAKITLTLSRAPVIPGIDTRLNAARWLMAPSLAALELGFNGAKYGELPKDIILEAVVPTLADPDLDPDGQHTLSALVQYVPHGLKQGWSDTVRQDLGERVIAALDAVAPGLAQSVMAREVLTPVDIEAQTGAPGGHWHHGELIADQMLMLRPVPGIENYRLPVEGFYLCGAAAHPGGDVTALPGLNAARIVLDDIRKGAAR